MSTLGRRIDRLEAGGPRPSPFDAMDPILAELSMHELIDLVHHGNAVREGRRPTPDQEEVDRKVRERMAVVGIMLP